MNASQSTNHSDVPPPQPRWTINFSFSLMSVIVLILVLGIITSKIGNYLFVANSPKTGDKPETPHVEKTITKPFPTESVNNDIRIAFQTSRDEAKTFAEKKLDNWEKELMVRVENDFLPWYFGYWRQQLAGIGSLWDWTWDKLWNDKPTMVENITENIQKEFANRVIRPEISQMQLERITQETVEVYIRNLQNTIHKIPEKYSISSQDWDNYLDSLAKTTSDTDRDRDAAVPLKIIAGSTVYTTAKVATMIAPTVTKLAAKIGTKVAAKAATKASAKVAAKSAAKTGAKFGGKMLGPIVGVGIIIWDVWDHQNTKAEEMPILKKNLEDYMDMMTNDLLVDPDTGILAVIDKLEGEMVSGLGKTER